MLATAYRLDFGRAVVFVALSLVLGGWVYWHASRHGSRHALAWAAAAFLFSWLGFLVYFLNFRRTRRRF